MGQLVFCCEIDDQMANGIRAANITVPFPNDPVFVMH
jgi:hypothetical protein